ncbi:MAG: YdcH family protein, partial [Albidovulum sp.]
MRQPMSEAERQALTDELALRRQEHRDLDDAILALEALGAPDKLQVQRLKKRKLALKDDITR